MQDHTWSASVSVCERDQLQLCLVFISATQRKLGDERGTEIKPRKRRRAEENKSKLTEHMAVVSHSAGEKTNSDLASSTENKLRLAVHSFLAKNTFNLELCFGKSWLNAVSQAQTGFHTFL